MQDMPLRRALCPRQEIQAYEWVNQVSAAPPLGQVICGVRRKIERDEKQQDVFVISLSGVSKLFARGRA